MDFQTAIKTLELNAGFSLVDVKRNYYKLSLKWHPDKNTSINSTKKFQEIAEAYEILKIYLDLENGNETNESNETNENDFLKNLNYMIDMYKDFSPNIYYKENLSLDVSANRIVEKITF